MVKHRLTQQTEAIILEAEDAGVAATAAAVVAAYPCVFKGPIVIAGPPPER